MFGLVRKRLMKREDRLNNYFLAAVNAYAVKGDEAAGLAAFLAAMEAPEARRAEMSAFLRELSELIADDPAARVTAARLDTLCSRIAAGRWGRLDVASAGRQLRAMGSDYREAHLRADAEIFARKYPDLLPFYHSA